MMPRLARVLRSILAPAAIVAFGALGACHRDGPTEPGAPAVKAVRVDGNRLVDGAGQPIRLRGVNHSGSEYACMQDLGIFDGRTDAEAVQAIASWEANVVRVPLNEGCWLGIAGARPEYTGANYRAAVAGYVARLRKRGLAVILSLNWSGTGTTSQTGQLPMPSRAHSLEFWRQVAAAYKAQPAVLFDLYNEPYPDGNRDSPEAWRCWKDGGSCAGVGYEAAGMQELVDAVRGTGATNVILVGGVGNANSLSGWLANAPVDPLHQMAASWHVYSDNACNTTACWDATAAPVAAQVPLVLGELGDLSSGSAFVTSLMDWMDARQGSYLAWAWNTWGSPLDLIARYDGTPTAYGQTFRTRFMGE